MAREESDRENLLQEMTALVERIELQPAHPSHLHCWTNGNVVVGFRANGAASFFFGDDPAYQFNSAGQLRRAYCGGVLFKAVGGRLVSLERVRQQDEVQLVSHPLSVAEQAVFTDRLRENLSGLAEEFACSTIGVVEQFPTDADVFGRVRSWLAAHDGLSIAAAPRAV